MPSAMHMPSASALHCARMQKVRCGMACALEPAPFRLACPLSKVVLPLGHPPFRNPLSEIFHSGCNTPSGCLSSPLAGHINHSSKWQSGVPRKRLCDVGVPPGFLGHRRREDPSRTLGTQLSSVEAHQDVAEWFREVWPPLSWLPPNNYDAPLLGWKPDEAVSHAARFRPCLRPVLACAAHKGTPRNTGEKQPTEEDCPRDW